MSEQRAPNANPDPSRRAFFLRSEMPAPRVVVSDECFAANGIYCESCRDACDAGALRFVPQRGSVPRLVVASDLCTQCGECVQFCPQDAIRVRALEIKNG